MIMLHLPDLFRHPLLHLHNLAFSRWDLVHGPAEESTTNLIVKSRLGSTEGKQRTSFATLLLPSESSSASCWALLMLLGGKKKYQCCFHALLRSPAHFIDGPGASFKDATADATHNVPEATKHSHWAGRRRSQPNQRPWSAQKGPESHSAASLPQVSKEPGMYTNMS